MCAGACAPAHKHIYKYKTMARPKKEIKIKEPVTIRFKDLKYGKKSIYLDIYVDGKRRYKFLKGMYLYEPIDKETKIKNQNTLIRANEIKNEEIRRIQEGQGTKFDGDDPWKNINVVRLMMAYRHNQEKNGKKDIRQIDYTIKVLQAFDGDRWIGDIDKEYCIRYLQFLRQIKKNRGHQKIELDPTGQDTISKATQHNYYRCFNCALNWAVRMEGIARNPFELISKSDKIKVPESQRQYLTIDEIKQLIATDCTNDEVKKAYLFGCFCGLRFSDIKSITWGQIYKDGEQTRLQLSMDKTDNALYLPLSDEAIKYMPEKGSKLETDTIFNIPTNTQCNIIIKKWAKDAGITKHVTFHVSRHSFATMMLTLGADLYTTSKLLGHADIETTQVYAKIINAKKDEAVNLTKGIF